MNSNKFLDSREMNPVVGVITGTRPGVIMAAPILKEMHRRGTPHFVIHSGQHYSYELDAKIFEDLQLQTPEYRLERDVHKSTHGAQTAHFLEGIEKVLLKRKPKIMLIFGDTNSNLAAALAARKLHITVAHVEAGERSRDWRKPEEHNRKIIDVISDVLFATGLKSKENLMQEGIDESKIIVVGNPIVDASYSSLELGIRSSSIKKTLGICDSRYGVMTMHREENVDVKESLYSALKGVSSAAELVGLEQVVFPVHPRTAKQLKLFGLEDWAQSLSRIKMVNPLGFHDFLVTLNGASLTFTDSGGVSQEACIHRIPCVCMLETTEWTEAVDIGAQILTGCDEHRIIEAAVCLIRCDPSKWGEPFGQGDTAVRIVNLLQKILTNTKA